MPVSLNRPPKPESISIVAMQIHFLTWHTDSTTTVALIVVACLSKRRFNGTLPDRSPRSQFRTLPWGTEDWAARLKGAEARARKLNSLGHWRTLSTSGKTCERLLVVGTPESQAGPWTWPLPPSFELELSCPALKAPQAVPASALPENTTCKHVKPCAYNGTNKRKQCTVRKSGCVSGAVFTR